MPILYSILLIVIEQCLLRNNPMNTNAQEKLVSNLERAKIEKSGTLHWFHWIAVCLSLLLTLGAWYFSKTQLEERIKAQFEREA